MVHEKIRRLMEHDPETWAELYDRHGRAIWQFMYRRVNGCREVADDLASETFMGAVEGIATCDPARGNVSQWLYGIARRKLADHWRQQHKQQPQDKRRVASELLEDQPAPVQEASEDGQRVGDTLALLPAQLRDVLVWMYQDELSVREIAARLNRTEKAVENLLYRARLRFRDRYNESDSLVGMSKFSSQRVSPVSEFLP